jgi:hypothetical protein
MGRMSHSGVTAQTQVPMLGIIVPQINLLSHRSINLRYNDHKPIRVFPLPFLFLKPLHEWKCICALEVHK